MKYYIFNYETGNLWAAPIDMDHEPSMKDWCKIFPYEIGEMEYWYECVTPEGMEYSQEVLEGKANEHFYKTFYILSEDELDKEHIDKI